MSRKKIILMVLLWGTIVGMGVHRLMLAVGDRAGKERVAMAAKVEARVATKELMTRLKTQLQSAMKQGGPAAAFEVCQAVAQDMTNSYANELGKGFHIGRTGLKLRNQKNAPNNWEQGWMERAAQFSTAEQPLAVYEKVTTNDEYDRELHYFTPIYMADVCLNCHGNSEQIPAGVQDLLNKRYPDDQAINFAAGEFRGIVGVTVNLDNWTPPTN